MVKKLSEVFVFCLMVYRVLTNCPKNDLIKPCICRDTFPEGKVILCQNITTHLDLEKIFQNMDKNLNETEKQFSSFTLKNTSITELKENTFKGITFSGEIFIGFCNNLTTINVNAFNGTESVTKYLLINYNPKLSSPDHSIFKLLNKFKNAYNIDVMYDNITEIPSNAFDSLNHLVELNFGGNSIKKIGSNAFEKLNSLIAIDFEQVNFTTIPDNAFQFLIKSDLNLTLDFSNNPTINNSIFTEKSFLNIKRPTHIKFGTSPIFGKPSKQMTYLNEKVFLPFLLENDKNSIDMSGEDFDCNDCRNLWLKKNPKVFVKINFLKCSNKKAFNDTANFKNCTSLLF